MGEIKIGFTSNIFKIPDLRMINNGTIYVSDLQKMTADKSFSRILPKLDKSVKQLPVLSVEVVPGDG